MPNLTPDQLRRYATYASVAVSSTLIATKLAAYLATESVSVLSSLIDSSTDLMASLVTLLGVRQALRPPDANHRYGHGKAEALAALTQAAFIGGSAVLLSVEAVRRLVHPEPVAEGAVGVAVMVLSIVLTAALLAFQRRVQSATGSVAIGADRLHYSGDLLSNGAVIVAILLTGWTGVAAFDPLFGLGIAGFLLFGARGVAREALNVLMDRELPEEDRARIAALVMEEPGARGLHDLRTRNAGTGSFIELHLELDGTLTLTAAHDIADRVERRLRDAFANTDVLVHQEPAGLADERLDHRIR
ncbi:cation diffusion facilitator family transporter [Azospirillum doebereinerae]|uniref:Protein p34 n=1 Tax=Azospirillum doebereinerae TaxID=92933 RepID=A0A3S0XAW8_9PROT|nr:cation diffusion facilitator family transporter [Azospirillum doebereinerae]MCG5241705.1 cation diffusion facilitator family transporter [Azospirillum doebereinerae]RUQ70208.1 cation diffusion facilitator family transporter [Azospirillum doebereinerae]